jgi:hypothetical protein
MTKEAYRVWLYLIRAYDHLSQRGHLTDAARAESLTGAMELLRRANIEVTDRQNLTA